MIAKYQSDVFFDVRGATHAAMVRPRLQTKKMIPFGVRPVHSATGCHGHGKRKNAKFNQK